MWKVVLYQVVMATVIGVAVAYVELIHNMCNAVRRGRLRGDGQVFELQQPLGTSIHHRREPSKSDEGYWMRCLPNNFLLLGICCLNVFNSVRLRHSFVFMIGFGTAIKPRKFISVQAQILQQPRRRSFAKASRWKKLIFRIVFEI
ncbi:hypothetical protein BDR26DRAFT_364736 [Obelidium mucronatum]|nr:hypothetical protein BDR26DRAFT_364736 [Obelidium mucronatum]